MPLGTIVGHRHVLELLSRAVVRQSLPPSLILTGPEGVGKRQVAMALAQVLNCQTPVRTQLEIQRDPGKQSGSGFRLEVDACGTCTACRRIARGSHPDVMLVEPEDEGGSIKVEQARDIGEHAAYRPYEGRRRVVIIDPADAMERSSQNALLKLLEEPPPATVFVLVTAQPDALLPTVRSRCPQIRFGPLTVSEIADVLMRERKLSVDEARAAAVLASGSVARAVEAASEDTSEARTQALTVLRDAATLTDRRSLLERMKATFGVEKRQGTAASEREQLSVALRALSSMLRDLALLSSARERPGQADGRGPAEEAGPRDLRELANADLKDALEPLVPRFGRDRVMRAYAAVDRALGALRGNTSAKLVVDWLAYQI